MPHTRNRKEERSEGKEGKTKTGATRKTAGKGANVRAKASMDGRKADTVRVANNRSAAPANKKVGHGVARKATRNQPEDRVGRMISTATRKGGGAVSAKGKGMDARTESRGASQTVSRSKPSTSRRNVVSARGARRSTKRRGESASLSH